MPTTFLVSGMNGTARLVAVLPAALTDLGEITRAKEERDHSEVGKCDDGGERLGGEKHDDDGNSVPKASNRVIGGMRTPET